MNLFSLFEAKPLYFIFNYYICTDINPNNPMS